MAVEFDTQNMPKFMAEKFKKLDNSDGDKIEGADYLKTG
jgi:hypothetical protein